MTEFVRQESGDPSIVDGSTTTFANAVVLEPGGGSVPAVDVSGAEIYFLDNDPAKVIAAALSATYSGTITGATIEIASGYLSTEDELQFVNQLGITGSWNSGTGILTLSGSTTAANYQTALRSVKYFNSNPFPDETDRLIDFVIFDGGNDSPTSTATVHVALVLASLNEFSTPGSDSFIVPPYHVMTVELWAGGSAGDGLNNNTYVVHGTVGTATSIAALSLNANPAALSTGLSARYGSVSGEPGLGSGGDLDLPGTRGGNGGYEHGGFSIPASPDQGGSAPFGGAGHAHPGGGSTGGAIAGIDGDWPGAGGSAIRLVGFSIASEGWTATHPSGGTSGAYTKKRYVYGVTDGAPEIGDNLAMTVGSGGAAVSGTVAVLSGKGADGGVRITIAGFAALTPYEGGEEPDEPIIDLGTAHATISGIAQVPNVLYATLEGDDPDSSTGFSYGLAYQWYRDGVAISGATGATYQLVRLDTGSTIHVTIDYTDAKGFRDQAVSAETDAVEAQPRPLDYFVNGELFAAYGLRLLRSDYRGPLFKLRNIQTEVTLDVYPEEDGEVDYAAIETWRATQPFEVSAIRYDTWYNQIGDLGDSWNGDAYDLDGFLATEGNSPEFAAAEADPYRLPNGREAVSFNGNEQFQVDAVAGPATNLGFLAVIQRDDASPGYVFDWGYSGAQVSKDAGFMLVDARDSFGSAHEFVANEAVFHGHGYGTGRSPRAISSGVEGYGYAESDADDAVIWDGELNATRTGIRRNGVRQPLSVDVHTSYTQPPALGSVLTVGPRPFVTGLSAKIAELVIFAKDVRQGVGTYRADAAGRFVIGTVENPSADDLSVDLEDDDGLEVTLTLINSANLSVVLTDDEGLDVTLSLEIAFTAHMVDDEGLDVTLTIDEAENPPLSQLMVICMGI